jgi:hypothetical protein
METEHRVTRISATTGKFEATWYNVRHVFARYTVNECNSQSNMTFMTQCFDIAVFQSSN